MNRHSRYQLSLEILEDRVCPVLNTVLDASGNLCIFGKPTTPSPTLIVTETAPDVFTVQDGANTIGIFQVSGNIKINLGTLATTTVVFFNLNGNATPGQVSMSLGNGPNDVTVTGGGAPGVVSGNMSFTSGASNDLITIDNTTVLGNLSANTGGSTGGDALTITDGSTIDGSVSATNVDNFDLSATNFFGPASAVAGNVLLTDLKGVLVNYQFEGAGGGNSSVGGSVIVNTNSGFSSTLLQISGLINQNLVATVGKGNSIIDLNPGSEIDGNVALITGSSSPSSSAVTLDTTTIGGNLTVVQGTGVNATRVLAGTQIFGRSIRYQGGAGNNLFSFDGFAPGAQLFAYMGTGIQEFDLGANAILGSGYVLYGAGTHITNIGQPIPFPFHVRNI